MSDYLKHIRTGPSESEIIQNRQKIEANKQQNEEQEQIKEQFLKEAKIQELSQNLDNFVNPKEKETILNRLLLKYEKNSKNFDFESSLKKVLLGENIGGIPSSGTYIEKDGKPLNKKEKIEIYKKLIGKTKQKDHFQNFHEHQKEKVYDPNDTIPSTEIPQFKDTGVENFGENNKKYETILNNLVEQGQLSKETTELLKKENLDTLDIEKTKIPEEEKKVLKEVFSNIKNPEQNKKSNLENLKKDLKEIQSIVGKENFDFNLEQNNQNFSQEVLNKIGGNYLNIQNKDGKIDYEKNFSLAIDTTKIQIENGVKNINKNSETYKQAIKNIASDNLATKLEGIQSLYALAYSGEGKFAKKSQEKYKKHRGEKLQKQYDKLNQELQELQKQQTEQAKKKTEQIKQEIESIQKEAKEISSGDIFKATKQETNDTGKEKEPTK